MAARPPDTRAIANPRGRRWSAYGVFLSLAWAAALGGVSVHQYFSETLPKRADFAAGRVHALSNHGAVVYMTGAENAALLSLFGIAVVSMIVAGVLRWARVRKCHR